MKPVNLVIVNPEGEGPWLSRIGRNSNDDEAVILFKIRGNESPSERMKLLRDQVRNDVILGRDAILQHLDKLGLESPVSVKNSADWEAKKKILTQRTDRFLEEVIEGKRVLPEHISVEIRRLPSGERSKHSETKPTEIKGFSLKRFFGIRSKSPEKKANEVRQAASQAKPVPTTGNRGLFTLFSRKTTARAPEPGPEKNIRDPDKNAPPDRASAPLDRAMDSLRRERMLNFNPGYTNLPQSKLQREIAQLVGDDHEGRYRSHLQDAVTIHESLWVTHGTGTVDNSLEVASLDGILATLRSVSILDLSPDAKQSIDVLGKAVSYYKHMQKNKTPGP